MSLIGLFHAIRQTAQDFDPKSEKTSEKLRVIGSEWVGYSNEFNLSWSLDKVYNVVNKNEETTYQNYANC